MLKPIHMYFNISRKDQALNQFKMGFYSGPSTWDLDKHITLESLDDEDNFLLCFKLLESQSPIKATKAGLENYFANVKIEKRNPILMGNPSGCSGGAGGPGCFNSGNSGSGGITVLVPSPLPVTISSHGGGGGSPDPDPKSKLNKMGHLARQVVNWEITDNILDSKEQIKVKYLLNQDQTRELYGWPVIELNESGLNFHCFVILKKNSLITHEEQGKAFSQIIKEVNIFFTVNRLLS